MPDKDNHWVSKRSDGWAHKREGASRAAKVYPTQREAADAARDAAKRGGGELFIKGRDGKIRERNTYGNDPFPPKG